MRVVSYHWHCHWDVCVCLSVSWVRYLENDFHWENYTTGIWALRDIGILETINYLNVTADALSSVGAQFADTKSSESKKDNPVFPWWSDTNAISAVSAFAAYFIRKRWLCDSLVDVDRLVTSVVFVVDTYEEEGRNKNVRQLSVNMFNYVSPMVYVKKWKMTKGWLCQIQ